MIRHIVLTQFRPEVGEQKIAEIYARLAQLVEQLKGAHSFTGGRSHSPEQMERGYCHAFTVDFDSWADLKHYADHPDHRELGTELVQCAVDGPDGLIILDLEDPVAL